jgi:hypothetical protein
MQEKLVWQTGYFTYRRFTKREGNVLWTCWETADHELDGTVRSVKVTKTSGIIIEEGEG